MSADPVRLRALDILVRVAEGGRLDALLPAAQASLGSDQERSLLAALVRGTLQWRERYRHVLKHFVTRELPEDPHLLWLLFLSLHQLVALDGVPAYAAVHQAGQLCRRRVGEAQVGFVNGVLQTVKRHVLPEDQDASSAARVERLRSLFQDLETDPVRHLAIWQSHPIWLVQGWHDRFGLETAAAICAANNQPVPLGLRILEPVEAVEVEQALAAAGWDFAAGPDDPRSLVMMPRPTQAALGGMLDRFPCLLVQDPVVQSATSWLLAARECRSDSPVWTDQGLWVLDMCAAPGGKTARLAAAWSDRAQLMAWDNQPARLDLLRDTLQRTGFADRVEVLQADAAHPPLAAESCAAVFLDGPCSGTGVLRHHPEGRWQLAGAALPATGRPCWRWPIGPPNCWHQGACSCMLRARWSRWKTRTS
jgi:16S rRNA (cytosine967-C5)-methyltransferase